MSLPFADIITITHTADCRPEPENPYLTGDCDPWGRLYNYPRIWLSLFRFFDIGQTSDNFLGLLYILVFAIAISRLALGRSFRELLVLAILLISPPVLLLLERGNSDLLVFAMVVFAVVEIRENRKLPEGMRLYGMLIVFFVLGMLKFYPFMLVLLLMAESLNIRRKILIFAGFTGLALLYLYLNREDVMYILANTPAPLHTAYGRNIYTQVLKDHQAREFFSLISVVTVLLSAFFWSFFGLVEFRRERAVLSGISYKLFIAGAGLYTTTFLIGNNFIYRLVHLLLCLPFLMELKRNREFKHLVNVTLLMLIVRFFYDGLLEKVPFFNYNYLVDILLSWGLFYTLSVFLFLGMSTILRSKRTQYK